MEPSTMWGLAFVGLLVLLGGSLGYTIAQAREPRLTAEQVRAIVDEWGSGPATWDDHDAEFFTRVVHEALGAFSPLNAGDVRQVVLAALAEDRDTERRLALAKIEARRHQPVARASRRSAKRGAGKTVLA